MAACAAPARASPYQPIFLTQDLAQELLTLFVNPHGLRENMSKHRNHCFSPADTEPAFASNTRRGRPARFLRRALAALRVKLETLFVSFDITVDSLRSLVKPSTVQLE